MRNPFLAMGAAATAMTLVATPVAAEGKMDRARAAIAEARGKVDTLNTINAAGDYPRMVADAKAALRKAEDDLAGKHKEDAIVDAQRASHLADTAIALSQKQQADSAAVTQAAAVSATVAAQEDAAAANARADAAAAQASAAQRQAAAAAAAADAARAQQAPAATTVTTETTRTAATPVARKPVVKRTTVRRSTAARPAVVEKTTTTVQTN